jgi:hypothetical protein
MEYQIMKMIKSMFILFILPVIVSCFLFNGGNDGLNHPKAMFREEYIDTLIRKKEHSIGKAIHDRIIEIVDWRIEEGDYIGESHDMSYLRRYGDAIINMSLAYLLTEDESYGNEAVSRMLDALSWSDWHDEESPVGLGHSHMLVGCALTYDWCYDLLTESQKQDARHGLKSRAEEAYQGFVNEELWWHDHYIQNHMWHHTASLGIASMALMGEIEEAEAYYQTAIERLDRILTVWEEQSDGANHEGQSYQHYGIKAIVPFVFGLWKVKGINKIEGHPYFEAISKWNAFTYNEAEPDTFWVKWADFGWEDTSKSAVTGRLTAAMTGDRVGEWLARKVNTDNGTSWNERMISLEYIVYDTSIEPVETDDLGLSYHADRFDAVIWRSSWDSDATLFAMKCGPLGGKGIYDAFIAEEYPWNMEGASYALGHDHWDAGGFIIYGKNANLAPEGWGSSNSVTECSKTEFHNTILVDGNGQWMDNNYSDYFQYDPEFADHRPEIIMVEQGADYSFAIADVTQAYGDEITGFIRHALFIRPDYFIIADKLSSAADRQFEWVIHYGDGDVTNDGGWIELPGDADNGSVLGLKVVKPTSYTYNQGIHSALHNGDWADIPYIKVKRSSGDTASMRFIMVLFPASETEWLGNRPSITLQSEDDTHCTLQVSYDGDTKTITINYGMSVTID